MEIHFIRHTRPKIDSGVCYGQSDINLADSFDEESEQVIQQLSNFQNKGQYHQIFSSPSKRCLLLANKIRKHQKEPTTIEKDKNLMELNFGDWELKTWNEIPREQSDPWSEDFINISPPNGENIISLKTRVLTSIEKIFSDLGSNQVKNSTENATDYNIAIITHAGVMRIIAAEFLGIPLSKLFMLNIHYGQILILTMQQDHFSLSFKN